MVIDLERLESDDERGVKILHVKILLRLFSIFDSGCLSLCDRFIISKIITFLNK